MGIHNYPYTNFHELNADWLLQEMKKVIAEWASTKGEWKNTREEFEDLEKYVKDYFKSDNISKILETIVSELFEDGEFNTIISANLLNIIYLETLGTDYENNLKQLLQRSNLLIILPETTINITEAINIGGTNLHIVGNNTTIKASFNSIFILSNHNIHFKNIAFSVDTDTSDTSVDNYSIASLVGFNNFSFEKCSFTGGRFGISLNVCSNAHIKNCTFHNFRPDSNSNGGHSILLQSCKRVIVENNVFENNRTTRHNVYVSINQEIGKPCQNIIIKNNYFNGSEQEYYATNTASILIRHCINVEIENNIFEQTVGIAFTTSEGIIKGFVNNNTFIDSVFRASSIAPAENRANINFNTPTIECYVDVISNLQTGSSEMPFLTGNTKLFATVEGNYFTNGYIVCTGIINLRGNIHSGNQTPFILQGFSGFLDFSNKSLTASNLISVSGNFSLKNLDKRFLQYQINTAAQTLSKYGKSINATAEFSGNVFTIKIANTSTTMVALTAVSGLTGTLVRRSAAQGSYGFEFLNLNGESQSFNGLVEITAFE